MATLLLIYFSINLYSLLILMVHKEARESIALQPFTFQVFIMITMVLGGSIIYITSINSNDDWENTED